MKKAINAVYRYFCEGMTRVYMSDAKEKFAHYRRFTFDTAHQPQFDMDDLHTIRTRQTYTGALFFSQPDVIVFQNNKDNQTAFTMIRELWMREDEALHCLYLKIVCGSRNTAKYDATYLIVAEGVK